MSDEEKKAIKRLEKFGDSISCSDYPPEAYIEMKEDIEDILYLLEKQSKEIEELKDIKQKICNEELLEQEYVKENFIHKDKIKAKIEEVSKGTFDAKIVLQSLLEKE